MLKLKQILCSILVLGSLLSSPSLWAQKETKVNIAARADFFKKSDTSC